MSLNFLIITLAVFSVIEFYILGLGLYILPLVIGRGLFMARKLGVFRTFKTYAVIEAVAVVLFFLAPLLFAYKPKVVPTVVLLVVALIAVGIYAYDENAVLYIEEEVIDEENS